RLEKAERGVQRDRRVDRGATAAQRLDGNLGRDRMRAGGGAMKAVGGSARGEAGADRPVAAAHVGTVEIEITRRPMARERGFTRHNVPPKIIVASSVAPRVDRRKTADITDTERLRNQLAERWV